MSGRAAASEQAPALVLTVLAAAAMVFARVMGAPFVLLAGIMLGASFLSYLFWTVLRLRRSAPAIWLYFATLWLAIATLNIGDHVHVQPVSSILQLGGPAIFLVVVVSFAITEQRRRSRITTR